MEATLKKYFWLIKLGGAAIAVVFAGSAVVNLAVSKLALDPAGESVAIDEDEGEEEGEEEGEDDPRTKNNKMLGRQLGGGATTRDTTKSQKDKVASYLVGSNIFCPTCAPEVPEDPSASATGFGAGPVRPGEVKSKLPLMLLATMESDDPEYSMATILHTDTNRLSPYSPNDAIMANVVVTRVERGRVVFRNGAQMEYIELGGEAPPPTTSAAPTPIATVAKQPKKNSREIPGASEAISCDSSFTNCTVERGFVEKLLSNPAQLTKQARIVPAVRDGETKGYKFYGIRPGSLPKLLGLKNGDLLTSVNGHKLESLDQAMDLYNKLRRASHLSVTLERKGQQVSKEIDIK